MVRTEQCEGEYITCFFLEEPKAAGALHSSSHPFTPTFGLCCLSGGTSPDLMIRLPQWHIPCLLLGPLLSGWGCKFYAGHLLPLHDLFQLPGIFHHECPRKEATTFVPGGKAGPSSQPGKSVQHQQLSLPRSFLGSRKEFRGHRGTH